MVRSGNVFAGVQPDATEETFATLAARSGAFVERIVSTGQASPAGFWYDQAWAEWVIVLAGEARLTVEGEPEARTLRAGDWLELSEHVRHRVEGTDPDRPTVWLAVHWKDADPPAV